MDSYIFDDGSLEAKVLQHEYPGTVIKVGEYNLNKWLSEVIDEDDDVIKVYLPFCSSSLVRKDIDIRTDIAEAHHNYVFVRLILPYEQMDRPAIERKAAEYGIMPNLIMSTPEHAKDGRGILLSDKPVTKDEIEKLMEENKNKIKLLDFKPNYSKYSVGGNDSIRSEKGRKKKKE